MSSTAALIRQQRLALGVLPRDGVSQQELVYPVRVELETTLPHTSALGGRRQYSYTQDPNRRPGGLLRHFSGRYTLQYFPGIDTHVDLRIYDLYRRYVPRRLRVPVVSLADVKDRESTDYSDYLAGRSRFPVLFPGAAYPLHSRVTGLRGTVRDEGGAPLRWPIIELRSSGNGARVIARARGDDRGEFLLLVPPQATPASDLSSSFSFDVAVWGPSPAPVPPQPDAQSLDPYWDAPQEVVVDPVDSDAVSAGTVMPAGYVQSQPVSTVTFQLGRLLTSRDVGNFIFSPP